MSAKPIHDWVQPRLAALLRDAKAMGFDPEIVATVIADLLMRPEYNDAPLPTDANTITPAEQIPPVPPADYYAPGIGDTADWIKPGGHI